MAFYPKTPSLWAMPAPVSQWMTSASRVSLSLKWVTLEYPRALFCHFPYPTARLAPSSPRGDMSYSHHKQHFLPHFSFDWLRCRATQNTQALTPHILALFYQPLKSYVHLFMTPFLWLLDKDKRRWSISLRSVSQLHSDPASLAPSCCALLPHWVMPAAGRTPPSTSSP